MPRGKFPYALRPVASKASIVAALRNPGSIPTGTVSSYHFVGDAYLPGFMDGEGYIDDQIEDVRLV
jgi:hypothetical protein